MIDLTVSATYFLLLFFLRAVITKYVLPFFSITPIPLISLLKKYLLIFIIIFIPFIILAILLGFLMGGINDISNNFLNENYFLVILYLVEAFAITKIIPDMNGNKIGFKIALVLVSIFFIVDTIVDEVSIIIEDSI